MGLKILQQNITCRAEKIFSGLQESGLSPPLVKVYLSTENLKANQHLGDCC